MRKYEDNPEICRVISLNGVSDDNPDDYDFGMMNKNKAKITKSIQEAIKAKEENVPKVEKAENLTVSETLAKDTSDLNTKQTSGEENNTQQQSQQQKNVQLKKAVEDINKKAVNSEAIFGIHEETNRVTIKIIDKDTKKVIKELPPEKTLDMIAKVWELAGLMVDEKR